jgi:hypothetical protein
MKPSVSSLSSLSRFVSAFLAVLVASLVGVSACGRSSLDEYLLTDGGPPGDSPMMDSPHPDGGGCNLGTCPNGCCDANAVCQTGTTTNQCGIGGQVCQDCMAEGFQFCSLPSHSCANKVPVCDQQTCPSGCCGGPNTCFAGNSSSECGTGGGPCQNCLQLGEQCTGQQCTQAACGPNNCNGCCFGDQCLGGTDQTACGEAGQQCQNCAGMGEQCVPQGAGGICEVTQKCSPQNCPGCCDPNTGVCMKGGANNDCGFGGQICQNCLQFGEMCNGGICIGSQTCGPMTCPGCCDPQTGACTPGFSNNDCGLFGQTCQNCSAINDVCNGKGVCIPPINMCNPMTCPFGCCDANNVCQNGMQDGSCGFGGNACQNCLALGDTCQGQVCQSMTPCSQNCVGCCDNNNQCQPGFLNKQCGEFGATCVDCTQMGSTCDVNVMPRTCANMQMQCPAPYGGCDPSLETAAVPQQPVCSANELQNARSACSGGANTAGCQAYFQFEFQQNVNCGVCLSNFDYDFNQLTGLFTCIAPFVDMTCNHNTACDNDCTTQSCDQCPDQQTQDMCINQVQNNNGQCSSYFMASGCVIPAFVGQGSFCQPQMYNNNFGRWLQGVGQFYCGM